MLHLPIVSAHQGQPLPSSPSLLPPFQHVALPLCSLRVPSKVIHQVLFSYVRLHFPPCSLLPADHASFYRYSGSLTTPGCYEVLCLSLVEVLTNGSPQVVTWTVLHDTVGVSLGQLEALRQLIDRYAGTYNKVFKDTIKGLVWFYFIDYNIDTQDLTIQNFSDHNTLGDNFREVQPLHGRKVKSKIGPCFCLDTDPCNLVVYKTEYFWKRLSTFEHFGFTLSLVTKSVAHKDKNKQIFFILYPIIA